MTLLYVPDIEDSSDMIALHRAVQFFDVSSVSVGQVDVGIRRWVSVAVVPENLQISCHLVMNWKKSEHVIHNVRCSSLILMDKSVMS